MTKNQIIAAAIDYEVAAGSFGIEPKRGNSTWIFEFSQSYDEFVEQLRHEIATHPQGWQERNGWPKENLDGYYSEYDGHFELWDENFYSCATIFIDEYEVRIHTAWSGFTYRFTPTRNGGIQLVFDGPRRALGTQNLLPMIVAHLLGNNAIVNPFNFLVGMYDADNVWFNSEFILAYYANKGWTLADTLWSDGWWQDNNKYDKE